MPATALGRWTAWALAASSSQAPDCCCRSKSKVRPAPRDHPMEAAVAKRGAMEDFQVGWTS